MQEDLEYTRKWKVAANVKNYAVVNPVNPVTFKRKWGEDELPIADQYTYLGVDMSKECSSDAHTESDRKG